MRQIINGVEYARVHNNVGFNPLPVEERGHGARQERRAAYDQQGRKYYEYQDVRDDLCCCRYCSATPGVSADNPNGVWDALATDLTTGKTWKVHFPELHGRRPKRRQMCG